MSFYGFFRMGELISSNRKRTRKVIQFQDVTCKCQTVQICQRHYKTRRSQRPLFVIISRKPKHCPVKDLKRYLKLRGSESRPLFLLYNGKSVTPCMFTTHFKAMLRRVCLSNRFYKEHSFRIGDCSEAILQGVPQDSVMTLCRWSSRLAFKRYIRIQ